MAEKKLIPAPLDEKNVTTDWIEEMFDDQSALYGKNKMLGFMAGAAMQASWSGNMLKWKVLDGTCRNRIEAIRKLRERYKGRYPDKESPFILKKQSLIGEYIMIFYWKNEDVHDKG